MATVSYPFDPSGSLASNLIQNEEQTLALSNNGYLFLVPFAGPFFKSSLKVIYYPGAKTLREGVDYVASHYFKSASLSCAKAVYGSITFFNKSLAGSVKLSYQTIGGEWVTTKTKALTVLANTLLNPRVAYWEQITDLPYAFPPVEHAWSLDDLVGMTEVVSELAKITAAIKAKNAGVGGTSSDDILLHLASVSNPHQVNKVQIGLGNVLNYGLASESEARVGSINNAYMTPYLTKLAINNSLSNVGTIKFDAKGYFGANGELTGITGGVNNVVVGAGSAKGGNVDNSIVLGTGVLTAQTNTVDSVVIGGDTLTSSYGAVHSVIIGAKSGQGAATGFTMYDTVIVGAGTMSDKSSTSETTLIGSGIETSATNPIELTAVGAMAAVNAQGATAIGARATAWGVNSVAIGYNTTIYGDNVVGFGSARKVVIGANQANSNDDAVLQVVGYASATTPPNADNSTRVATTSFVKAVLTTVGGSAITYDAALFNYKGSASELSVNTTGNNNIALGFEALKQNTTGNNNVAIGTSVMKPSTIATFTTGVGALALASMTTGGGNTAVGYKAGYAVTTGSYNVAIGESALRDNVGAHYNVAVGRSAGLKVSGAYNTLLGNEAGGWMTSGANNVAVGYSALSNNDTGGNNTALGANANVSTAALNYATAVGANAYVSTSNTVTLGRTTDTVVIGATGASGTAKLQVTGTISATTPTTGDNTTLVATTAFVNTAIANIPAATWTSVTSKPTTLAGFGITDAQAKNTLLTAIAGLSAGATGYVKLTNGVASLETPSGSSGSSAWADITGTPTTLSGYGITDGQTKNDLLTAIAGLSGAATGFIKLTNGLATLETPSGAGGTSAWADITGKPTTLSGYGITDAQSKTNVVTTLGNLPENVTGYIKLTNGVATLEVPAGGSGGLPINFDGKWSNGKPFKKLVVAAVKPSNYITSFNISVTDVLLKSPDDAPSLTYQLVSGVSTLTNNVVTTGAGGSDITVLSNGSNQTAFLYLIWSSTNGLSSFVTHLGSLSTADIPVGYTHFVKLVAFPVKVSGGVNWSSVYTDTVDGRSFAYNASLAFALSTLVTTSIASNNNLYWPASYDRLFVRLYVAWYTTASFAAVEAVKTLSSGLNTVYFKDGVFGNGSNNGNNSSIGTTIEKLVTIPQLYRSSGLTVYCKSGSGTYGSSVQIDGWDELYD